MPPMAFGVTESVEVAHDPIHRRSEVQTRSHALTIEAEDALIAALKVKHAKPDATITYVRKSNRRGDYRHPHEELSDQK